MLTASGCSDSGEETTEPATTDASTSDTGELEPLPDVALCELYLACLGAVDPDAVADATALYGEGGSCWQDAAKSEHDCLSECRALLKTAREQTPWEMACYECQAASECGEGFTCSEEHAECFVPGVCGDGEVALDEECDNADDAYCLDCQYHLCSPFDPSTCGEGERCNFTLDNPSDPSSVARLRCEAGVGTGMAFTPCATQDRCSYEYACTESEPGSSTCSAYCDVGHLCLGPGNGCDPWPNSAPTDIGVCRM